MKLDGCQSGLYLLFVLGLVQLYLSLYSKDVNDTHEMCTARDTKWRPEGMEPSQLQCDAGGGWTDAVHRCLCCSPVLYRCLSMTCRQHKRLVLVVGGGSAVHLVPPLLLLHHHHHHPSLVSAGLLGWGGGLNLGSLSCLQKGSNISASWLCCYKYKPPSWPVMIPSPVYQVVHEQANTASQHLPTRLRRGPSCVTAD